MAKAAELFGAAIWKRGWRQLLCAVWLALPLAGLAQVYVPPSANVGGTTGQFGSSTFSFPDGSTTVTFSLAGTQAGGLYRYGVRTVSAALNTIGAAQDAHFSGALASSPALLADVWGTDCPLPGVAETVNGVECGGRGTLTVRFSRPVSNPRIHLGGLGTQFFTASPVLRFNAIYTLTTADGVAPSGAAALTKISGNSVFEVVGNRAINTRNASLLSTNCNTTQVSACGTMQFNGLVTELVFAVSIRGWGTEDESGNIGYPQSQNLVRADGHTISASIVLDSVLRLQKSLPGGRAVATDQFQLGLSGPGAPVAVTTTGAGTVANGALLHASATPGSSYTFSEAVAAGASFANYNITYACTNARAGAPAIPGGTGTSFNLIPVAGDNITCRFINTRKQADLSVNKSVNPSGGGRIGTVLTYSLTVDNAGPDAANDAVLRDAPGAGLDCVSPNASATCTASGGAACPGATVPVASLIGTAGIAIPVLPSGGRVVVVLQCTVLSP